jgi:hypothetical protein
MANDDSITGPAPEGDLDRLIGELETEAARRRAEPGYPHDDDARLHFELARRAPRLRPPPAVRAFADRLEEAVSPEVSGPAGAIEVTGSSRHQRQVVRQHLERIDSRVTSVGLAVAAALRAVAARLDRLEEHMARSEPPTAKTPHASPAPAASDTLARWEDRLPDALPRGPRVLYADAQVEEVVARLRAAGVDAYGVTGVGPRDRPGPDVRYGDVLDHLGAVPDGGLGAVLLVGMPEAMRPESIGPLCAELGRVAGVVVIISEAQWWWRQRLGAVQADLAPGRPLDPDTWLDALHNVAMDGTAEYDTTGRSYRVVARAHP